ncbi:hypothetical protein [Nitrospira sp. Nam80]
MAYYIAIAPSLLPAIADRPMTYRPYPHGAFGRPDRYHQRVKHAVPQGVRVASLKGGQKAHEARFIVLLIGWWLIGGKQVVASLYPGARCKPLSDPHAPIDGIAIALEGGHPWCSQNLCITMWISPGDAHDVRHPCMIRQLAYFLSIDREAGRSPHILRLDTFIFYSVSGSARVFWIQYYVIKLWPSVSLLMHRDRDV